MSDKFRIDSHKLIFHPQRVSQWLEADNDWEKEKKVYPIYVEMSPYGGCNHRCTFCGVDYMGYQNIKYDTTLIKERIAEMGRLGVKSIMFAGEGEPLLHKDLAEIIEHTKKSGIDPSITTNFVPANASSLDIFLKNSSWIKISINAGSAATYANIHKTKERDFDKVLENMRLAVEIKRKNNYSCTLGAQLLLLPENANEVLEFSKLIKEIGLDYIVIKPYSQHLFSETKVYEDITYDSMLDLERDLKLLNGDGFSAIFRAETMKKMAESKVPYERCYSTPFFWGYVSTDGNVYGCSCYLGQTHFCYGNINDNTFEDIWESGKRKESLEFIRTKLDITQCRTNCRMDAINRYLWELKHPNAHVNFI